MTRGVYWIRNTATSELYIGSALDVERRWYFHLYQLRAGIHPSPKLQQSWTIFGEESFAFEVIEVCEVATLRAQEKIWQEKYKPTLNERLPGYAMKLETIAKIREAARRVGADPEERKRRAARAKAQHQEGRFSKRATGYVPTAEAREKIRQANLRRYQRDGPPESGEMSRRSYCRKIFKEKA